MKKQEMLSFEQKLLSLGYKRWNHCLYGTEDYDVSKVVRDNEGEDKYQIIFRFWDFTKYNVTYLTLEIAERHECSVDLVIMPCLDGRADLILSSLDDKVQLDIERMEKLAEDYYDFVISRLNKDK
jgi:hypothetical protein